MKKIIIPTSSMGKLLKEIGAERISREAKIELSKKLEEYGKKIGEKALKNSNFSGRKTIKKEDIELALKEN